MSPNQAAYLEFLKSPFWVNLSRQKRQQVGHCERCKSKVHLQCHHKFYRSDWNDTQADDLEVLCRSCHKSHHGIRKKKRVSAGSGMGEIHGLRARNQITRGQFMVLKNAILKGLPMPKVRIKPKRKNFHGKRKGVLWIYRKVLGSKYVNRGNSSN